MEEHPLEAGGIGGRNKRNALEGAARGSLRTMTATSVEENPPSFALDTAWSDPRGTFAFPGLTSMLYGLAASALRETISSADIPCRRNAGPKASSSAVAAAMPPAPQMPAHARPLDRAAVVDRAAFLDGLLDEALDEPRRMASAPVAGDASIALRMAASSVGSHSSR